MLRGESLRSIAMDWNERGVKSVGGGTWQGSMIRWVLMSPRSAGLKDHRGEVVGGLRGRRSSTAPLMISARAAEATRAVDRQLRQATRRPAGCAATLQAARGT